MKKLLSLFLLLLLAATGWAQPSASDFWITGRVYRTSDLTPIQNHTVTITESNTVLGSVSTDANGYYSYVVLGGSQIGPNRTYTISTLDCQNFANSTNVQNAQGTVDTANVNFYICDFNSCSAGLTITSSGFLAYTFDVNTTGTAPFTYTVNFGDGPNQTFTSVPFVHTYSQPGNFNVCVYVADANGCIATACDSVSAGGCNASLTYQPGNAPGYYYFYGSPAGGVFTGANVNPNGMAYFDQPGTYQVCYTVNTNGLTCTECETIVYGDSLNNCTANYTFSTNDSANFVFIGSINGVVDNNASYVWDFGDGTTSNIGPTNQHSYTDPGVYYVCLYVTNDTCSASYCGNVIVPADSNYCQASFIATPSNPNNFLDLNILFNDQSTAGVGSSITNWLWNFGDGSSSTDQNPSHDYSVAGSYVVCLTITTTSGCTSTYCDSLIVGGNTNTGGSISGSVYTDNSTFASVAYVFLLKFDYANSALVPQDAGVVTNGGYLFSNVPNGDYLVKAALTPNDPLYASRIPTYHLNADLWNNANTITVNNSNEIGKDILMIAGVNPGGPGFIGGTVDWADTLRALGDFAGATVIVQDIQDNYIAYAIVDDNGAYTISNLAYGTYKLTVDYPGFNGEPKFVTLTPFEPSANNVQLLIGPADVTTTVSETSVINSLNLFPNPTADIATLMVETTKASDLSIDIVNLMGQKVAGQKVNTGAGKNFIQLPVEGLAKGIYTIVLRDTKGVAKVQKLIKQ